MATKCLPRIAAAIAIVLLSLARCQGFTPRNCRTLEGAAGSILACNEDEVLSLLFLSLLFL
ncbi:unnamed protein product [Darwinula stevensoni]|uniref:Uncharacterized protein n=1 Tax=Darwinula stevensoni TaxID=69355 RepID=A0A7R9A8W8_9CRUS|nr:unnamed protein product [Darwinula stevensoni]CAG0896709.1 unnamed protein product [Darwinula stevensoni]